MKKLILIILIPIITFSQNIWESRLDLNYIPDDSAFNNFDVVDSNTIYATSTYQRLNYLYKSTNQGRDWELVNKIFEENLYQVYDIEALDSMIYLAFISGQILKSTDYGKSFDEIKVGFKNSILDLIMFNTDLGVTNLNSRIYLTKDKWNSSDTIPYQYPYFLSNMRKLTDTKFISQIGVYSSDKKESYEIFTHIYDLEKNEGINISSPTQQIFDDLCVLNDSTYFLVGKINRSEGTYVSGRDAIFKSTDSGKSWSLVLDLFSSSSKIPNQATSGLQKIAFKNDSVGICVGRYGKILYTYDGGESWFYEQDLPSLIELYTPSNMIITYAGDKAIIADLSGTIHTLEVDNLAPKPEDTLTISGKIHSNDSLAITNIPIRLNNNRITMTDKNGFYKFTKVSSGSHTVTCLNKYVDSDPNMEHNFNPFTYSPIHEIELNNSVSNIDFNVKENTGNFLVHGLVTLDGKGIEGIEIILEGENQHVDFTSQYGFFSFKDTWKAKDKYTITPNSSQYKFEPKSYSIYINKNHLDINFTASPISSVYDKSNFQVKNSILISKDFTGLEYKIITLNGNIIESGILPKELNLNQPTNGTYILNITKSDKVVYTYKFQVVR